LRYGLEWDRDYLVDIVFTVNSILPIISLLTIYPANFYLLTIDGPSMKREIRVWYIINMICFITCDLSFAVFVRPYFFAPYGLFYCEGLMSRAGMVKPLLMGALGTGLIMVSTSFFILMMRLHQLTVAGANSMWKLSYAVQLIIYASVSVICVLNLSGFVIFSTDVDNYDELLEGPELAWMKHRGGSLLLFGEPGKISRFRIGLL
ncbi:hypothetical protein PENTCL1PPCAC_14799, partial [Pristionchus entomophagus]